MRNTRVERVDRVKLSEIKRRAGESRYTTLRCARLVQTTTEAGRSRESTHRNRKQRDAVVPLLRLSPEQLRVEGQTQFESV